MTTTAISEISIRETEKSDYEPRGEQMVVTPSEEFYAFPPTKGQERFWSLDQLNPGNPALNMPLMWKFTGPVDLGVLRDAFTQVVERHESLRTTFDVVNGHLMQIVRPAWPVPISVVDLSQLPDAEFSLRAQQLTNEHAALRMNLRSGPLLAAKLLRFGPLSHMLLVTLHHIICDGMSTGVLLRDVAALYESLIQGKPSLLPQLPVQFADYAVEQQVWREGSEYEPSLNFWRRSLGTNFSRIRLPYDGKSARAALSSNSVQEEYAGAIETLLLEQSLAENVDRFCKRHFITHNVFFFSIFSIMLSRISGQRDLLIGSPSANRIPETENLVGMFMNIQAMRVKLEESDTFISLAEKIQQWTLQAYENQQLPFEDLIYDQQFSSGSSSLEVPVFFLYQKSFMVTHQIGDLKIVPLRSMSPGAAFEIMFAVVDRVGEGPRLQFEFNPAKFRTDTVRRFLELYVALSNSALHRPEVAIAELDGAESLQPARGLTMDQGPSISKGSGTHVANDDSVSRNIAPENRTYRDAIEFQLVEIWQATLGIPYISVDDGFFSLGVSSLSALRLITKINRIYSTNLGLASLFSASTIRAIAVLIRERLSPNMDSSLVPIQPLGTRPPLFVVHGVRGNVLSFYGLVTYLGKDQPLYGIQAQALVKDEPALLKLEDMARYYIAEMRKVQAKGPYNLLGYSFGGIVAMEMAQQLKAAGEEVGLLGMLDSKSPDYMRMLLEMRSAPRKSDLGEPPPLRELTQISRTEKVWELVERIRARLIRLACQIATMVNIKTIPAFMKDPWSINFVANSKYEPQVYDGRMTLFRAVRQRMPHAPADLGWGRFFTGGVDVRELPGTHETLWSEQHIEAFAHSLADSLQGSRVNELVNSD